MSVADHDDRLPWEEPTEDEGFELGEANAAEDVELGDCEAADAGRRFAERDLEEQDDWEDRVLPRWPLDWRDLLPRERWLWFAQLWEDTCRLRERYRLAVRTGWWEHSVQVEALAALVAWVDRYDSGEWEDPPGKLALLYELERVGTLLRDGGDPFHQRRDKPTFLRHLVDIGCQPPRP